MLNLDQNSYQTNMSLLGGDKLNLSICLYKSQDLEAYTHKIWQAN